MMETDKKKLVEKTKKLMSDKDLTEALCERIEEQRGSLGFLLSMLKKRPRTFNPYVLKGISLYKEPSCLDTKTAELVAVGAAAALRCEYCLDAHMGRALEEGAVFEEVLDAILISAAMAESSTLSVAFRKYRQQEGRAKRRSRSGKNKE